jgi:dCMP deaminase
MDVDEYFIKMARLASLRGACVRRQVGCVLTNDLNHIIATGYNGRARGVNNCLESPCNGSQLDSGMGLEQCEAIHAEANALLQCKDVETIKTAYCTTAPCIHCIKLLMNTSCERIVFQDTYPHMEESKRLWLDGRFNPDTWEHFPTQMEIFTEPSIEEGACEHSEWKPSSKQPEHGETLYRTCIDCGIIKEVCK